MPIEFTVEEETGVILERAWGEPTAAEELAHQAAVGEAIGDRVPARLLADRREVVSIPDTPLVRQLIERLRSGGGAYGTHLAFVIPQNRPAMFGMGRMYQTLAEDVDLHVRFFTSMDEARTWLMAWGKPFSDGPPR